MRAFAVVAALVLASGASAVELGDAVRAQIDADLPAGLGVVDVALPNSSMTARDVSVRWVVPPHAGIVPIAVTWRHGRGMAQATLAPLRRVMIVARALPAGAKIDDGDLIAATRAVVDVHTCAPENSRGMTVARDLTAGDVLHAADLAAPTKVARGSHIRVIVRRGGVTIATEGVLERATAVGDRGAVRVTNVPQLINGRLRDDATLVDEVDAARAEGDVQ